jgi:hypothetical protein
MSDIQNITAKNEKSRLYTDSPEHHGKLFAHGVATA